MQNAQLRALGAAKPAVPAARAGLNSNDWRYVNSVGWLHVNKPIYKTTAEKGMSKRISYARRQESGPAAPCAGPFGLRHDL
jgi:hypothetical protein